MGWVPILILMTMMMTQCCCHCHQLLCTKKPAIVGLPRCRSCYIGWVMATTREWGQHHQQHQCKHCSSTKAMTSDPAPAPSPVSNSYSLSHLPTLLQKNSGPHHYPTWAQMAWDYLAIQGSVTPSECAFSGGGITGTACHSCLTPDAFEALQILKKCISKWPYLGCHTGHTAGKISHTAPVPVYTVPVLTP